MATKRRPLSKKVRFEVFKRDGFNCMYCGAHPPSVLLEVDHITPVAAGGGNEIDNLVTSCEPCNRGKGATSLASIPQNLADKAKAFAEREEQIKGFQRVMDGRRQRIEAEAWKLMNLWRIEQDSAPSDWIRGMRTFVERLGYYRVLEAVEISQSKCFQDEAKTWRYFCGVCWNMLRSESNG